MGVFGAALCVWLIDPSLVALSDLWGLLVDLGESYLLLTRLRKEGVGTARGTNCERGKRCPSWLGRCPTGMFDS